MKCNSLNHRLFLRTGDSVGAAVQKPVLRIWIALFLFGASLELLTPQSFQDSIYVLRADQLPLGDEVKSSGKRLLSQPYGFTHIKNESSHNHGTVHVAVHGLKSEGYEWVGPIVKLSEAYKYVFFYRYNWEDCPDSAAERLAVTLPGLVSRCEGAEKLVIFGHSYGGLVVTFSASKLHFNIPVEIHTIAAPLGGYSRLFKTCDLKTSSDGRVDFPAWDTNITHIQWRTQHRLDNAFKRFRYDPQETTLRDSDFFRLPATMDSHRLGHNWSITWVIDEYLDLPHRP